MDLLYAINPDESKSQKKLDSKELENRIKQAKMMDKKIRGMVKEHGT